MNRITTIGIIILTLICMDSLSQDEIQLLIRSDDIGSTHAANLGCIKSYQEGITQSVEIMVPCPWFPEAARMLAQNPGLDVGIHITLTSEWDNFKWRPITHAPSITDEDGFFFPAIWPSDDFPEEKALKGSDWEPGEIEAEMRAQIELATKYIPQITHLSCHMGCAGWDDQVGEVFSKLAKEYGLNINPMDHGVKRFPMGRRGDTLDEWISAFIDGLNKLEPGNTYMFVEHPALKSAEMEAIGRRGDTGVNRDRNFVTQMFTSNRVKQVIVEREIQLISYKDLVK